jgi:hypothetical protein
MGIHAEVIEPSEIVDRTPFPHEDGLPRFTHINDPSFEIELRRSD